MNWCIVKEHCLRRDKVLKVVAELVQMRDHVMAVIEFKAEQKRRDQRPPAVPLDPDGFRFSDGAERHGDR